MKKILFLLYLFSCSSIAHEDLRVIDFVDAQKFIGEWNVVATFPRFETRRCVKQKATYSIKDEYNLNILNTCTKKNGSISTISGNAEVIDKKSNAILEVTFNNFWTKLFRVRGDYRIIALDKDYQSVMVGTNSRKALWIMTRTGNIDKSLLNIYIEDAKVQGFDTSKLIFLDL